MSKKDIPEEAIDREFEKEPEKESEPGYFKSIESSVGKISGTETIKPEIKKEAGRYITKEQDEATLEFMREIVADHKQELKEEGFWVENGGDKFVVKACTEKLDWKGALESDDKYKKYKDNFEHFDYLSRNFNKENVPEDAKFLMVNKLYKTISEKEEELEEKGKNTQTEAEIKKLYALAENISNDISGVDIRKETEKEVTPINKEALTSAEAIEEQEKAIRKIEGKDNKTREKSIEDTMFEYFGYEIKKINKGFWRNEEMIISKRDENGEPKKVKSFELGFWSSKPKDKKKYDDFLKSKLQEEIKNSLDDFYEISVVRRNADVDKKVREKIKEISSSPEKARGGIEAYFEKLNQKDIEAEKKEIERRKPVSAKKNPEVKKVEAERNESLKKKLKEDKELVNGLELSDNFEETYKKIGELAEVGELKEIIHAREYFVGDEWFQKNINEGYKGVFKNRNTEKGRKAWDSWLDQFLLAIIKSYNKK